MPLPHKMENRKKKREQRKSQQLTLWLLYSISAVLYYSNLFAIYYSSIPTTTLWPWPWTHRASRDQTSYQIWAKSNGWL